MRYTLLPALILAAGAAQAHFGMIIPEDAMIAQEDGRGVDLTLSFSHPFEEAGMTLEAPVSVSVTHDGETTDLTGALTPAEVMGDAGFALTLDLPRPGSYVLAMEPQPYWEPAEDAFIIHYTKTYVGAYGVDDGWDAMVGMPVEILPLDRPYGLWEGNIFRGQVLRDGEPVPFAEVEVEHYNQAGVPAPSELMITQTIVADGDGVFSYAPPGDGWWGFAALMEADYTLDHEGSAKGVELGAVLWVHFEAFGE
ncbi:MAG: cobalt/nickel transport protein [Rhodobacteraceae bacterium HLUCCA08]|nr:MAG: cobalt/nickel transport protein [Rhodobacteraceae bacterium HLUCCA08]